MTIISNSSALFPAPGASGSKASSMTDMGADDFLTLMIAQVCDLEPGEFVHTFGDVHLYNNHLDQAKLQLGREPRPLPQMVLNPDVKNIFDFEFEDFELKNYDPHPHIKAQVSV